MFHSTNIDGRTALTALLLVLPCASLGATQGGVSELEIGGTAAQQRAVELTVAQPTADMDFVVDLVPRGFVYATSTSKTLQVSLIDPSGTETFLGSAGPGIFGSSIFPIGGDVDPMVMGLDYVFSLDAPQPGTWTLRVTETAPLSAPLPVLANALLESEIKGLVVGGGQQYPVGASVGIGVAVTDASGLLVGAAVSGTVFRPGDAGFPPVPLTFADDGSGQDFAAGDGMSTGATVLNDVGTYEARITIDGVHPTSGLSYRRTLGTSFVVLQPTASLVPGTLGDQGIDADADMLFEEAQLSVDVDASAAGTYRVSFLIEGPAGETTEIDVTAALGAGVTNVVASFPAKDVHVFGDEGVWTVRRIELQSILPASIETQDLLIDAGTTQSYLLAEFERDPIVVLGFTETPVDCDGDLDFDQLEVTVHLDSRVSGGFSYDVRLLDVFGQEIHKAIGSFGVGAGQQEDVSFTVQGPRISANGVDGPYIVGPFILKGINGTPGGLFDSTVGVTQPYAANDFQTLPLHFDDGFEAHAVGPVDGQLGWTQTVGVDPAAAAIATSAPLSGAQALELGQDTALAAGMQWGVFSPQLSAFSGLIQRVSATVSIDALGGATYEVVLQSPTDGNVVARIRMGNDGTVEAYQDVGAGLFDFVDTGYDWATQVGPGGTAVLDFTVHKGLSESHKVSLSINGIPVFLGEDAGGDHAEQLAFLTDNAPGSTMTVDDVQRQASNLLFDCNGNGEADACEVAMGDFPDCNGNRVPDSCDINQGLSTDCDLDGLPDDCELDCNANGIPDPCEILMGLAPDCDGNGVPDDCDIASGANPDCNGNLIPDSCDIAGGFSLDCNGDGIPEECEPDCNLNQIPDPCEVFAGTQPDCNANGVPDSCDIGTGFSVDCNANGVPDECDSDCNANGIPDDCQGNRLHVDPNAAPGGDGLSWATAYSDLESALAVARCSGYFAEVWVAAGTYLPTDLETIDPRSARFRFAHGLTVLGGFAGGETSAAQRDPVANPTILTGDLLGDDGPDGANVSDNMYRIAASAVPSASFTLDGFTLRGGNADGDKFIAGALLVDGGDVTVRDCVFRENRALIAGGAVVVQKSASVLFESCRFEDNATTTENGGALLLLDDSGGTFDQCVFVGNTAAGAGGAVRAESTGAVQLVGCVFDLNDAVQGGALSVTDGGVTLSSCTVLDNRSTFVGGAVDVRGAITLTVVGGSFTRNDSPVGGALSFDEGAAASISGAAFVDNGCDNNGGAASHLAAGFATYADCSFSGSTAGGQGGAIRLEDTDASLTGCTFTLNDATSQGGAISFQASTATLDGCTFTGNTAGFAGGSLHADGACELTVVGGGFDGSGAMQGGAALLAGASSIELDGTSFDGNTATQNGAGLLLIDASSIDAAMCTFDSNQTSAQGGAVFLDAGSIGLFADCAFDGNTGDRGAALASVGGGLTVDRCDFDSNVVTDLGGAVYGSGLLPSSFTDSTFDLNGAASGGALAHIASSPTYIGCDFTQNSASTFAGAVSNRSASAPLFQDCTFVQNDAFDQGGAMRSTQSSAPVLEDCVFDGNTAKAGGAHFSGSSSPVGRRCTFVGNSTSVTGGALDLRSSGLPTFEDCTFDSNSSVNGGAVAMSNGNDAILLRCVFVDNTTTQNGAAISIINSTLALRDSLVARNGAGNNGGGLRSQTNAVATITGCTLTANTAGNRGGGMHLQGSATLTASILYGNSDNGGMDESAQIHVGSGGPSLDHVCLQGVTGSLGGVGVIGDDPLFAAPGAGDYHLAFGSPCRDAGPPGFVRDPGEVDLDGEARVFGPRVDLGSDEVHDCDGSGGADVLEVAAGTTADCNGNGFPDSCDLASGVSLDGNGDALPDECDTLFADLGAVSLAAGGTQNLTLAAGAQYGGLLYAVLGTASGPLPGITVDGVFLPLTPDGYTIYTLENANGSQLVGTFAFLAPDGTAAAQIAVAPGAPAGLAGLTLHHAFAVLAVPGSGSTQFASNAVALDLLP